MAIWDPFLDSFGDSPVDAGLEQLSVQALLEVVDQ